jgi:hypothetical protein
MVKRVPFQFLTILALVAGTAFQVCAQSSQGGEPAAVLKESKPADLTEVAGRIVGTVKKVLSEGICAQKNEILDLLTESDALVKRRDVPSKILATRRWGFVCNHL